MDTNKIQYILDTLHYYYSNYPLLWYKDRECQGARISIIPGSTKSNMKRDIVVTIELTV